MTEQTPFSSRDYLAEHSAWGRWGDRDRAGAANLLNPAKVLEAIGAVRHGRVVSLARPVAHSREPGPGTLTMESAQVDFGNGVVGQRDVWRVDYHGFSMTHIDAPNHVVVDGTLWNGAVAADHFTPSGIDWADIAAWGGGIVTRGVLFDVPKLRGRPFVTDDEPITGAELRTIAERSGLKINSGDAVLVFAGRDAWAQGRPPYGSLDDTGTRVRPGLHPSCLEFFVEADPAVIIWDMLDIEGEPDGARGGGIHQGLHRRGFALIDNADLTGLAAACEELGQAEFMVTAGPLPVRGATGSPINPLVIL